MKKIGRYEVIEELGRGAMGVVYKASDPTIGRMVAIKVLLLDDKPEAGAPNARDIFMREARAAGRLSHPGIVTIHDALEDETTRSSYIVMEYIPGRTLEKTLLSTPKLDTERALDIIRQVAEALEYAHRNLIIHRDLKPANIILTEDGRTKITDFGIAKIAAQSAMRTVAIMGTPSYMSPEQVTGGEIDGRTDLFSMGILLYLMLVGERPFAGDTAAVMFKIVYEDPVQPTKVNPLLPPALDYLILRCLAKDRAKRYASAREFLDDLDDVRHGRAPRSQARVSPAEVQTADRTMAATGPLLPLPPLTPAPAPEAAVSPVAVPTPLPPLAPAGTPTAIPQPAPSPAPVAASERKKASRGPLVAAGIAIAAVIAIAVGVWVTRRPGPTTPLSPGATTSAPAAAPESAASPGPAQPTPTQPSPSQETAEVKPLPTESKPPASSLAASRASSTLLKPGTPTRTGEQPLAEAKSAPVSAPPAATKRATAEPIPGRPVTLYCKHEFEEATLLLLSGGRTIYQGRLIGKKKRGFIGIAGKGFSGELSEPVTIPGDAKELTIRVYSADGAVNVLNKISPRPPSAEANVLLVSPTPRELTLEWTKEKIPAK